MKKAHAPLVKQFHQHHENEATNTVCDRLRSCLWRGKHSLQWTLHQTMAHMNIASHNCAHERCICRSFEAPLHPVRSTLHGTWQGLMLAARATRNRRAQTQPLTVQLQGCWCSAAVPQPLKGQPYLAATSYARWVVIGSRSPQTAGTVQVASTARCDLQQTGTVFNTYVGLAASLDRWFSAPIDTRA